MKSSIPFLGWGGGNSGFRSSFRSFLKEEYKLLNIRISPTDRDIDRGGQETQIAGESSNGGAMFSEEIRSTLEFLVSDCSSQSVVVNLSDTWIRELCGRLPLRRSNRSEEGSVSC